jgi:hypothetical protein
MGIFHGYGTISDEIEFIVCRLSHHVKLFDVNMSHYKKFKNNKKI